MGAFDFGILPAADVTTLASLSDAAYAGEEPPAGWETLTADDLDFSGGIFAGEFVGNYYEVGIDLLFTGAARVMRNGDQVVVSFRGTDSWDDYPFYIELIGSDEYVRNFKPLLDAVADYLADQGLTTDNLWVTGHSLGAAAVNQLQNLTTEDSDYAAYDGATFVGFASPVVYEDNDVLNVGFEDDWVFKALARSEPLSADQPNRPNATNNIIWYDDNYSNRDFAEFAFNPVDDTTAHHVANYINATGRIRQSMFYDDMTPDSVIIVVATSDQVTDWDSPTSDHFGDPAYYIGRAVADDVLGGTANDSIEGFAGDDTLEGASGDDRIDGGEDVDTAVYRSGPGDYYIADNGDGTMTVAQVSGTPSDGTDTLSDIEQADFDGTLVPLTADELALVEALAGGGIRHRGTGSSEYVGGTDENDSLAGRGDRDGIFAYGGDDEVSGGRGNDVIVGGEGDDTLNGSFGDDEIIAGAGDDTVTGALGRDSLDGGSGDDTMDGGLQADLLIGGSGDDSLRGWRGDDAIFGRNGNDTLDGGPGNDTLGGGRGEDLLIGGAGNDVFEITSADAVDTIQGFDAGDIIALLRDFAGLVFADLVIDYDAATDVASILADEGAEIARVTALADVSLLDEGAFLFG